MVHKSMKQWILGDLRFCDKVNQTFDDILVNSILSVYYRGKL